MAGDEPPHIADDDSPVEPLAVVREVAARRQAQQDALRRATEQLAVAMKQARKLGAGWEEIAGELGMSSARAAQSWAQSNAPRSETSGVTVAEAARRLGLARNTVYAHIESGKLRASTDASGRTWVLLD